MEHSCSRQCLRRSFFAVMIGVAPVAICLVLIAIVRLILYRLEIVYHRRKNTADRRLSLLSAQSGRLALSYTPVSNAELQRIILGEYQNQQSSDFLTVPQANSNAIRKTPRFIKSILTRREAPASASSILANLVIRHDITDVLPMPSILQPLETPLQPTCTIINEQERQRRPSLITITREQIETTTLAALKANKGENSPKGTDVVDFESTKNDPVLSTTKTITTTTVVVEEFLDFHSVSSLPCVLSLLDTIADTDNDPNFERNKDNDNA